MEQRKGLMLSVRVCFHCHILLFISNVELDAIQSSRFLVMDGTFDKRPAEFEGGQIYTMHTELNGEADTRRSCVG